MAHHHHHHHHSQQVFVIQVSDNAKGQQLALPGPSPALLPSEVKYSASLVRGTGFIHLSLGAVVFMLGVLGNWVEPETTWPGSGIWGGLTAITCGLMGLLAYKLWYKNFSIKAFLVSSVASVIIQTLAVALTVYAIINRQEHYRYLLEESKKNPWFRPFGNNEDEHRLSLSIGANQLIGFILELVLSMWTTYIAWHGVRAEEFSSERRDALLAERDDGQSTLGRSNRHIPMAALFQMLQAHPEMTDGKSNGVFAAPWEIDDRQTHHSMDYQERVRRYLTQGIEDHKSTQCDNDAPCCSSSKESSGGRGSPASSSDETAVASTEPFAKGCDRKTEVIQSEVPAKSVTRSKKSSEYKTKIKAPSPKPRNRDKVETSPLKAKEKDDTKIVEHSESQVSNVSPNTTKSSAQNINDKIKNVENISKDKVTTVQIEVAPEEKPAKTEQNENTDNKAKSKESQQENVSSKEEKDVTVNHTKETTQPKSSETDDSVTQHIEHIQELKPPSEFQDNPV